MKGLVKGTTEFLTKHGGLIFTVVASLGVVATGIAVAMETPKAKQAVNDARKENENLSKKDEAIILAKNYILSLTIGTGTVACVIGSNYFNKKDNAAITAAYLYSADYLSKYKSSVKDIYGEDAHNLIVDKIMKEEIRDVDIYQSNFISYSTLDVKSKTPEVVRTFYDEYSNRYFESTMSKVLQAEYHFNRNFTMMGVACVNDFYDFLGLSKIENGDDLGWSMYDCEMQWIDIQHRVTTLDDGLEVVVIQFDFDPELIEEE